MIFSETEDLQNLALLAIQNKGYRVILVQAESSYSSMEESYQASNGDDRFFADDLLSLLGLIELGTIRGEDWRLDPDELDRLNLCLEPPF
jgi:hypothetical protein